MAPYFFTISLAILMNVFYHILLKLTPNNINPLVALATTYATAMVTCLIIFPFYSGHGEFIDSIKKINWTSIALGISIVGLETGFILAYRVGWSVSIAALFSNVAITVLLIPIGLLLFKEEITIKNIIGIILCISGLLLIKNK